MFKNLNSFFFKSGTRYFRINYKLNYYANLIFAGRFGMHRLVKFHQKVINFCLFDKTNTVFLQIIKYVLSHSLNDAILVT